MPQTLPTGRRSNAGRSDAYDTMQTERGRPRTGACAVFFCKNVYSGFSSNKIIRKFRISAYVKKCAPIVVLELQIIWEVEKSNH